jgi:predicted RNA binding protein YcfA (HicA-like mRNA interferase family)
MSKLKLLTARDLEILILKLGFTKSRQKGSHAFYKHYDGRATVIPFHSSKDLPRPIIRAILREIELTVDEYNELV